MATKHEPLRAAEAILSIWELEATDTYCDHCSRPAKFTVFIKGIDLYCCVSHTRRTLERAGEELRDNSSLAALAAPATV